jgi:hypothetical protein
MKNISEPQNDSARQKHCANEQIMKEWMKKWNMFNPWIDFTRCSPKWSST